ncbi:hypothetical protein IAT38_005816 [Cryptococcus sp. DSM 104549]
MDVDKSLDEIAAEKRKANPKPAQQPPRKTPTPRNVSGNADRRQAQAPYARPPPRSTEDRWVHDAYSGPRGHPNARGGAPYARGSPLAAGVPAIGFTGVSPRIEIVGLHYEVTPDDLRTIFSQAGTIVSGPTIRYDRSGRSLGVAVIEYESPGQAKVAINKFDGAKTKGQTISIRLVAPIRTGPIPGAPAPGGNTAQSLLSRIQGAPGAAPVSKVGIAAGGSRGVPLQNAGGPLRGGAGRGAGAAAAAGGRGGAGGRGRGGRERGEKGEKRGPKTEVDLDKELDSFMNTDKAGDVEMA